MKIYTKTGDNGKTSLFGGTRVPKHNIRIDSYGTVDELNSWLGLIADQEISELIKKELLSIQKTLFTLGAELATEPAKAVLKNGKERLEIERVTQADVHSLENSMDKMDASLPKMTHFILPGGHPTVSYCHIARTVCRRAERKTVLLFESEPFDRTILEYLNRLSDYLFVLARKLSLDLEAKEIKWIPDKKN